MEDVKAYQTHPAYVAVSDFLTALRESTVSGELAGWFSERRKGAVQIKRVAVYCGSSAGNDEVFSHACGELARVLIDQGTGVVYGGGNVGLMGILADEMIKGGGEIIGVIPQGLAHREIAHDGLKDLRVVGSMHERKLLMAELADGFIALPGGTGTLEELLEAFTWTKIGIHRKPCGVLNVGGFYDLLGELFDNLVRYGFLKEEHKEWLVMAQDPETLLEAMDKAEESLKDYKF